MSYIPCCKMERPSELLKPFADRLARLAASGGGAEMIRLLYLARLAPVSVERAPATLPAAAANSDQVGVWERRSENGKSYFIRNKKKADEWFLWANIGRINPKTRRRVVLLGESVARGHLYDPQYTPAMALESILQSRLGENDVEVVDLARTNLKMDQLLDLARCALALEPDAVVIFAGNNWRPSLSGLDDRRSAATILREDGVKGLKRYAEDRLRAYVEDLVETVATIYEAANIPVIWIVPDYNLVDWRDPEGAAPCLEGANLEWADYWRQSRNSMAENNPGVAFSFAQKMVEIDGGTSPTAFYALAECCRRMGDKAGRRLYLELARDASIWDKALHISPRPYSVAQETLRRQARGYGNALIDMPRIYSSYSGGEPPDRRLFLDYVHLTAEGIKVTMAATASCLLNKLKGVDLPWESLVHSALTPGPQVEAEASFLAAIHNAHYGQAYDVIRYYCFRSAEASPEIAQVMNLFIDMQTRRAPFWMCKLTERLAIMQSPSVQHYLLRTSVQLLDRLLIGAVVEALKKVGIDAQKQVAELRRQEHSLTRGARDMLDFYYCATSPLQRGIAWNPPMKIKTYVVNHYYKAYEPESRFFFVGEKSVPVELHLTCRLSDAAPAEATLAVEVNNRPVGAITASREWRTWRLEVVGDVINDDVNDVVIRWPEVKPDNASVIERAAADIEQGQYPDLHPVLGEVHTFVASVAGGANLS